MDDNKIRVGVTQGDINGIGYEVILKTFSNPLVYEDQAVVLYGSSKVVAYHKKVLDLNGISINTITHADEAQAGKINLINCTDEDVKVELGQSTSIAGKASFQALEKAVSDLKDGLIDVLVTAPINKSNIQSPDFTFPGHTEYLESSLGDGKKALMIMAAENLRVAVATGHIPLADVPASIDEQQLVKLLRLFNRSLMIDFGIQKPRIAVLGLNPHAGDNGVIGKEDQAIVAAAVQKAQEQQVCCFGPIPADGLFGSGEYQHYDGILAMYHDQGLIPFKVLCMDKGVNFTAGLPYVRTSPAHGTAYALAGLNIASETSFREAYYLACDVFKNRGEYDRLTENPLRKQRVIQSGDLSDLITDDET